MAQPQDVGEASWRERVGGLDLLLALFAFLVFFLLLGGIFSSLLPDAEAGLALALSGYGLALLLGAGITLVLPFTKANRISLGLVLPNPRWLLIGSVVGLFSFMVDYAVLWGYATLAGGLPADPDPAYTRAFDDFVVRHAVLAFASLSLLGPAAEEVFFRGLLHTYLRRWGSLVAFTVGSLLFGLAHGLGPFTTPSAVVFGALMALLYEWSCSLATAMVAHAVHNALLWAPFPPLPS